MDVNALAQEFTSYFYQEFQTRATRMNVVSMYEPTASVNYNGRTYNGEEGVEQLFEVNFELGDMQIQPLSTEAVPSLGGALVLVSCQFNESSGMTGTFNQSFLLQPGQGGNISIAGDIFMVNM